MIACQQGLEHDVRNIIRKKVGQPIYLKKCCKYQRKCVDPNNTECSQF